MTLYNKDGSVFKLSTPNPVMKDQKIWTGFTVHNMEWKPEVKEDGTAVLPLDSDFSLNKTQSEIFLDELNQTKDLKPDPEQIFERKIEEKEDKIKKEKQNKTDIEKTFVYCLPATIRETKDELYGDIIKTIQYDKPTSLEAVILSQTDMTMEMWTETNFGEGSILYPKNGDKRWWKIQTSQTKLGGWILKCIMSQDQPSFDS